MFGSVGPILVSFRSIIGSPVDEGEPALGSGGRFKKLEKSIEDKEGYSEKGAAGLAAKIGREKFGTKKMVKMAKAGKARAAKK